MRSRNTARPRDDHTSPDHDQALERARETRAASGEKPRPTRPYLTNEEFGRVRAVPMLDPRQHEQVRAAANELAAGPLQGRVTFEAVLQHWRKLDKADRPGELACAYLWARLDERGRKARDSATEANGATTGQAQERKPDRPYLPPVQHRFVNELERLGREDLYNACDRAYQQERPFPHTRDAAMAQWTEFTKRANEEFKNGRGSQAERDIEHRAFALTWRAAHHHGPIRDREHLRELVDRCLDAEVVVNHRARDRAPEADHALRATLYRVRSLAPQLQDEVLASAREMLAERHTTREQARLDFPDAAVTLRAQPTKDNAIYAMTLAIAASTRPHEAYLDDLKALAKTQREAVTRAALQRIEAAPTLDVAPLRQAFCRAAVDDLSQETPDARREALVAAVAVDTLEKRLRPVQADWNQVGTELAADLAKV